MLYLQRINCKLTKNRTIRSIISLLLIILIMIGSTGAVVVKHTCVSCGLSDFHTELFSPEHLQHACDCEQGSSSCHNHEKEVVQKECCTYSSVKLSVSDYNKSTITTLSAVTVQLLSCMFLSPEPEQQKSLNPLNNHNKYGGRDVLISNCQFII